MKPFLITVHYRATSYVCARLGRAKNGAVALKDETLIHYKKGLFVSSGAHYTYGPGSGKAEFSIYDDRQKFEVISLLMVESQRSTPIIAFYRE